MSLTRRYQMLALVAGSIILLDQVSKRLIVAFFGGIEGGRRIIVAGFFDLVLAHNPGAAFSSFAQMKPDWLRGGMFIGVSVIASVVVIVFARRAKPGQSWMVFALSLILGGALGNLVDRVLAGEVVDFLEFYSNADWMVRAIGCNAHWGCRFPAFNVADSAICVGTGLLILATLVQKREASAPAPAPAPATPLSSGAPPQTPPRA